MCHAAGIHSIAPRRNHQALPAVTEFGRERQHADVAGESARGNERVGLFAHELLYLTNTAIVAFEVSDLFRPFTQRSPDRSGVGLGLAFARWAAEANHGQLVSHNLRGKGCIFRINLPRVHVPVAASQ